jgi:hypothetical protein
MSMMADCTCSKKFGYVFGDYEIACPRHGSTAKWLEQKREQRAEALRKLREQALTRPAHGGYPVAAHALNTTPVVDQKTPPVTDNEATAEIDRDTDGELLIDWSPSKGRMVTLSLRADGRLSYAFTWDGEKAHGTAQMPAGVKENDDAQP